jgi:hypothetical protein
MTHAEALDKAAKLLRLANSSNPHESALAAARAQEIMDRFKLTQDAVNGAGGDVQSDEPIRNFTEDPLDPSPTLDRWKGQLAMALAAANQCKVYKGSGRPPYGAGLCTIGRASNVQTVRYLYSWLTREIERLAAQSCAGNGRTYWNNFRLGATETVCRRLREQAAATVAACKADATAILFDGQEHTHEEEAATTRALALIDNNAALMVRHAAAVEDWTRSNLQLRARSGGSTRYNSDARAAGRRAGESVRMGAHAALNSTRQALR